MAISDKNRKKLHGSAGGQCSFADCHERQNLEEAHIVAEKPGGPRGSADWLKADLDAYDNRILLCATHHALVDANPTEWTVAKLLAIKESHEANVTRRLGEVSPPRHDEDLLLDLGAPQFHVHPTLHDATTESVRLQMEFGQTAGDEVNVIGEWAGARVEPYSAPNDAAESTTRS
jgi:hypothetical protein